MNSGVVAAGIWLLIALAKASKDMSVEQGEELASAWTAWPGLFLLDGLLMVLGLSYLMLAACMFFYAQPKPKRRKRIPRRRAVDAGQPLEAESSS